MNISKTGIDGKLTVALEGRLDTTTAPLLEKELLDSLDGISELIFDLERLEYISSAGLRVLLASQKRMNGKGSMVVTKACDVILEVFEVTGFSDILTIK